MSSIISYKQIAKLSQNTFNFEKSMAQIEEGRTYEDNMQVIAFNPRDVAFTTRINDNSEIITQMDQIDLFGKSLGDFISMSNTPLNGGDLTRLGHLRVPNSDDNLTRLFIDIASKYPKADSYQAIYDGIKTRIPAIVGSNYPVVSQTGLKTFALAQSYIELLPQLEPLRTLPDNVRTEAKPLIEAKFDQVTGNVHAKIVHDFVEIKELNLKKGYAWGTEIKDNYHGSGILRIGGFSFILDCFNGNAHRNNLSTILANHSSVQNLLKPMHITMLPDWGRPRAELLSIVHPNYDNTNEKSRKDAYIDVLAVMTRMDTIIQNPTQSFKQSNLVFDSEHFQELFQRMLVSSIIFNNDMKRELEVDVLRQSAQTSVSDVRKELEKLVDAKKINKGDIPVIEEILENDPIIEDFKDKAYGLGSAITRFANNYADSNIEKYSDLQELGRNVMEVLPTVNYSRKRGSVQTY